MSGKKLTGAGKALIAFVAIALFTCMGGLTWTFLIPGGDDGGGGEVTSNNSGGGGGFLGLGGGSSTPSGPLGSETNPIQLGLVSFHGYGPALMAQGGSLTTQPGSIYDRLGVHVDIHLKDDIPELGTQFNDPRNPMHCSWRTSDFWAQEHPNLRGGAQLDGKAIMVVDNTQGADAIIARDPNIRRIEDLAGKRIALLEGTPSHGLVIYAVENSSLSARKKQQILSNLVFITSEGGLADVLAAFESGSVDAAAMWDPELHLALARVQGSHVVYSTKQATNLIYDVIVCDTRHLIPENHDAFKALVEGWMQGVTEAETNPDAVVTALVENEEMFKGLAQAESPAFIKDLFDDLVWTGLEDNIRILGLAGGTNQYERVYRQFDGIYRAAGLIANPNYPVIQPQESFDYSFIRALMAEDSAAQAAAAKPEFTFTAAAREQAVQQAPALEKPVIITFATGRTDINERGKRTINEEMVPLIESNGSSYFTISGNTDSTGGRSGNMRLSQARAESVVDYLVGEWEFERTRFNVVGNGPDSPLCDEANPTSYEEGTSLEDCRKLNRTVRIAVQ